MSASTYNTELNTLLALLTRKARGDAERGLVYEIDNKLRFVRNHTTVPLIELSLNFFAEFNDSILERNEDTLFNFDVAKRLTDDHGKISDEDMLLIKLSELIRSIYKRSNKTDKDAAYNSLLKLHEQSIAYGAAMQMKAQA